jgi:hypothetical protein
MLVLHAAQFGKTETPKFEKACAIPEAFLSFC